jgi:hypothetical protein
MSHPGRVHLCFQPFSQSAVGGRRRIIDRHRTYGASRVQESPCSVIAAFSSVRGRRRIIGRRPAVPPFLRIAARRVNGNNSSSRG